MGWYKAKVTKVSLEDLGYPDLWVEIVDKDSMTYGEARALANRYAGRDVGELDPEEARQAMVDAMQRFVVSWNLPDPDSEDGSKIMPTPKEDPDGIDKLPMEVLNFIATKGFGTEEAEPPNSP